MVAVRMVSEGVDVPRLAVGVYATSASTPLYFAQAIGRFVRARRRGELASIFLPSVPPLLGLAAELERERDHALDREVEDGSARRRAARAREREDKASEALLDECEWTALGSVATFEKVLFDGEEYGRLAEPGSAEEWDFIGIPGILEPEQVSRAARASAAAAGGGTRPSGRRANPRATASPRRCTARSSEQRKLLNGLVSIQARSTGATHAQVHAEVRRLCGGPEVARATVAQLQARIDLLRRRIGSR